MWQFKGHPALVAHRGFASHYPENTLESISAAIKAGAYFIEFDIQLSQDLVPILLHDADLQRTAGRSESALELNFDMLSKFFVGQRELFGNSFASTRIPSLREAVDLLASFPEVTAFVEVKIESLLAFGREEVLSRVLKALEPISAQSVIISYDDQFLQLAKEHAPIGWVIHTWNTLSQTTANSLQPQFLFCNYTKIPDTPKPLWPGDWEWILYEVVDQEVAALWRERGAGLIETMEVEAMLNTPLFLSDN